MSEQERIRHGVAHLRAVLADCLSHDPLVDLVFIGNASDVYEWVPSRIVDVDCFVFTREYGARAGAVLVDLERRARREIETLGLDFELRLIKGAYKPDRRPAEPPIICAHLGLFDDRRYLAQPALHRWAWRKYRCVSEPGRLARLAPVRPTVDGVLHGPRGAAERLTDLGRGGTTMIEYVLPELAERRLDFAEGTPQFVEFCYASAASCARHHARALGYLEADTLGNAEFFAWYGASVLADESLQRLMTLKAQSRNAGYAGLGALPRELATRYLEALLRQG